MVLEQHTNSPVGNSIPMTVRIKSWRGAHTLGELSIDASMRPPLDTRHCTRTHGPTRARYTHRPLVRLAPRSALFCSRRSLAPAGVRAHEPIEWITTASPTFDRGPSARPAPDRRRPPAARLASSYIIGLRAPFVFAGGPRRATGPGQPAPAPAAPRGVASLRRGPRAHSHVRIPRSPVRPPYTASSSSGTAHAPSACHRPLSSTDLRNSPPSVAFVSTRRRGECLRRTAHGHGGCLINFRSPLAASAAVSVPLPANTLE